jgi:cytochrome P450 family 110
VLVKLTDSLQSPLIGSLLFFPSLQKDWGARSPWGYFRSLQRQVSELVYAQIRERRSQNHAGSDILSLLISARDETGQPMTDAELHDELITLLIAGQDTTATAIAWGLYAIHRHPEVGDELLAQLESLGKSPEPTTIAQLPYLTAVCHETLRLFPTVFSLFLEKSKNL